MTRKDYIALAFALLCERPNSDQFPGAYIQWRQDVCTVARVLANDNPRFNRDRFFAVAGLETTP